MDAVVLARGEAFDADGLMETLEREPRHACGGGPMVSVLWAAALCGATRARVAIRRFGRRIGRQVLGGRVHGCSDLAITNSGLLVRARHDDAEVGRLEAGVGSRSEALEVDMVGTEDQRGLLRLAREALEARVGRRPPPVVDRRGALDWPRGVFGTIHCQGDLRGCLGRLEVDAPLGETVAHLAAIVSDSDPRFAPVASRELGDIDVEISVLTPEREIRSAEESEVGCHGLIIEDGERRGLLLLQVATEHG